MTDVPIKDAATVVLIRRDGPVPTVLMGQRGAKAAFMPDKFVFPGGRVDDTDHDLPGMLGANPAQRALLDAQCDRPMADALVGAAVRELWEETGLMLGAPCQARLNVARDWAGFYDKGLVPDGTRLRFFFRAVTPPGRPRRFDARFLMCDAHAIRGDLDDFTDASGELSHLQWVALPKAREFALPFITEVVLAEVEAILAGQDPAAPVPFFHHGPDGGRFRSICQS